MRKLAVGVKEVAARGTGWQSEASILTSSGRRIDLCIRSIKNAVANKQRVADAELKSAHVSV